MYVRVKRLEVVTNVNIKYDAKVLRVGWDIRHMVEMLSIIIP